MGQGTICVLKGDGEFNVYERERETADSFTLPPDHTTFQVRIGLR